MEQLTQARERAGSDTTKLRTEAEQLAGAGNTAGVAEILNFFQGLKTGSTMAEHIPVPVVSEILAWIEDQANRRSLAWLALDRELYELRPDAWNKIFSEIPANRMGLVVRFVVYRRLPDDPYGTETLAYFRSKLSVGPRLDFYDASGRICTSLKLGKQFARCSFTADQGYELGRTWRQLAAAVESLHGDQLALVNPPCLIFDSWSVAAKISALVTEEPEEPESKPAGTGSLLMVAAGVVAALVLKSPVPLLLAVPGLVKPAPLDPGREIEPE